MMRVPTRFHRAGKQGVRPLWREGGPFLSGGNSDPNRDAEDCADEDDGENRDGHCAPGPVAPAFEPLLLEAAAALLCEMLFPILHPTFGRMNFSWNQD